MENEQLRKISDLSTMLENINDDNNNNKSIVFQGDFNLLFEALKKHRQETQY